MSTKDNGHHDHRSHSSDRKRRHSTRYSDSRERLSFNESRLRLRSKTPIVSVWASSPPRNEKRQSRKDRNNEEEKQSSSKYKHKHSSSRIKSRSTSSSSSSEDNSSSDEDEKKHSKSSKRSKLSGTKLLTEQEIKVYLKFWEEYKSQTVPLEKNLSSDIGPMPLQGKMSSDIHEEDGIVKFIKKNKRIPSKEEAGITNEEIEKFENIGFLMSNLRDQEVEKKDGEH